MIVSPEEFWVKVYAALDSIEERGAELLNADVTCNYALWPIRAPLSYLVREPNDGFTRWEYCHFTNYRRWVNGYWVDTGV